MQSNAMQFNAVQREGKQSMVSRAGCGRHIDCMKTTEVGHCMPCPQMYDKRVK